jgi:hypothetical protein
MQQHSNCHPPHLVVNVVLACDGCHDDGPAAGDVVPHQRLHQLHIGAVLSLLSLDDAGQVNQRQVHVSTCQAVTNNESKQQQQQSQGRLIRASSTSAPVEQLVKSSSSSSSRFGGRLL